MSVRQSRIVTIFLLSFLILMSVTNLLRATTRSVAAAPTATYVGGPITANTTWTTAGSPYILTSTVDIQAGVALTITPGVVVMGQTGTALAVSGSLTAVAAPDLPITFTSTTGVPGSWNGVNVLVAGTAHFQHAVLSDGDSNLFISGASGGSVILEDTTLRNSSVYPLNVRANALHRLQMHNVSFVDNAANRVWITDYYNDYTLTADTTLTTQPGLEGYEVRNSESYMDFIVPSGVTLTLQPDVTLIVSNTKLSVDGSLILQPGVTLMFDGRGLRVKGLLEANGTITSPVTFTSTTGVPDSWDGVNVLAAGTARFQHAVLSDAWFNLFISGANGGSVILEDTTLRNSSVYPLNVSVGALHRLQMHNVSFIDNAANRILIDDSYNDYTLTADATLTTQPGLEGYEIYCYENYMDLIVPSGITLTLQPDVTLIVPNTKLRVDGSLILQPGVTLMFNNGWMSVQGSLEAKGTITAPITFTSTTGVPGSWSGVNVLAAGTARFQHAVLSDGDSNLFISGVNGGAVILEDTTLRNSSVYPLNVRADALPRLQMHNVSFVDNVANRVWIEGYYNNYTLTADTTLTTQPGLEGYEVRNSESYMDFIVPSGVTLTLQPDVTLIVSNTKLSVDGSLILQPDVTLMFDGRELSVQGLLEANGTITAPVTFTSTTGVPGSWSGVGVSAAGTARFQHAVLSGGDSNLSISGANGGSVFLEDTTLRNSSIYPLNANVSALHRLQMHNVSFVDNAVNRILIDSYYNNKTLAADVTLTAQSGLEGYEVGTTYNGSDYLMVPPTVTLTLEPNVTLMFPAESWLDVGGSLQANGTVTAPVTFTSANNLPGGWTGILVEDAGSAYLSHSVVHNAIGNNIEVRGSEAHLLLENSLVTGSTDRGISLSAGQITAVCSTITANQGDGIYVDVSGTPVLTISASAITDNGGDGLHNANATYAAASYNWWGAADGPGGDGAGSGDEVRGFVWYMPWLTAPSCELPESPTYTLFLPLVQQP